MKTPLYIKINLAICLLLLIPLLGCEQAEEKVQSNETQVVAKKSVQQVRGVLARVNGEPITEKQLEFAIKTTLGSEQASLLDKNSRSKVLKSVVMSKAMAMAIEKELTESEQNQIKQQVNWYREQLLAKKYLQRHSTPKPVTEKMVKQYYNEHPERFGGKLLRRYEMIAGKERVSPQVRDALIKALKKAEKSTNWSALVNKLQKDGYAIQYRQDNVNEKILHPQLFTVINYLKVGETSKLTFVQGKPFQIRVLSEEKKAPRPLQEVSAEIRKALGPVQLKKAIQQVSDNLMQQVKVEYEK